MPLKIIFAGTPAFGMQCFDALIQSQHTLQAVYTQPDRPAGRGRKLQISDIKARALEYNLPIHQPENFKSTEAIETLAAYKPDLLIVIAYGLILPKAVLNIPRFGCINVHASLLPNWRGASPIQHAILHGDKETGVTIMQMDVGMDTGDIITRTKCLIDRHETATSLHDKLAILAVTPLLTTINAYAANEPVEHTTQDNSLVTYASKINKTDAAINWVEPAEYIDRQIRAFNPWPIAYTQVDNTPFRIHQARMVMTISAEQPGTIISISSEGILVACGAQSTLLIEKIQQPGGTVLSVANWMHAGTRRLKPGSIFQ